MRKVKEIFSCFWQECSFLRSFFSFSYFFYFTIVLSKSKRFGHAPKRLKTSGCIETYIGPTVGMAGPTPGAGRLHRNCSFRNLANFWPRTKLFAPKQRWSVRFSKKTWQNVSLPTPKGPWTLATYFPVFYDRRILENASPRIPRMIVEIITTRI